MSDSLLDQILTLTGAKSAQLVEDIQSLWSGYGVISRYLLEGHQQQHVVVKHVRLPDDVAHPRGWNTPLSHQRKIRSYKVESAWYEHFNSRCDEHCRVAHCYGLTSSENEYLMILEDLDEAGYPLRHSEPTMTEVKSCLRWLAYFHARFMGQTPEGLWKTGTYWHLETRPDELEALTDTALKEAAAHIDKTLADAPFQTLVHGDAKLANFCFSADAKRVAAVDFQYVGGGCGMKDVAYFIGSCVHEEDCERLETPLLDYYFGELENALELFQSAVDPGDLETCWRPLYPVAWADFHRFLKGWSPGHWKIHSYSEKLTKAVIESLTNSDNNQ